MTDCSSKHIARSSPVLEIARSYIRRVSQSAVSLDARDVVLTIDVCLLQDR